MSTPVFWTPQRHRRLRRLFEASIPVKEIAYRFEVTSNTIYVQLSLMRLSVRKRQGFAPTEESRATIARMVAAGASYDDIVTATHFTRGTVRNYVCEMDLASMRKRKPRAGG